MFNGNILSYEINDPLIEMDFREHLDIEHYESVLIIGNMKIKNIKHFNWFQRIMWKFMFGIKIINLEKSDE